MSPCAVDPASLEAVCTADPHEALPALAVVVVEAVVLGVDAAVGFELDPEPHPASRQAVANMTRRKQTDSRGCRYVSRVKMTTAWAGGPENLLKRTSARRGRARPPTQRGAPHREASAL